MVLELKVVHFAVVPHPVVQKSDLERGQGIIHVPSGDTVQSLLSSCSSPVFQSDIALVLGTSPPHGADVFPGLSSYNVYVVSQTQ